MCAWGGGGGEYYKNIIGKIIFKPCPPEIVNTNEKAFQTLSNGFIYNFKKVKQTHRCCPFLRQGVSTLNPTATGGHLTQRTHMRDESGPIRNSLGTGAGAKK